MEILKLYVIVVQNVNIIVQWIFKLTLNKIIMKNIFVPSCLYDKQYDTETDTCIFKLNINNSLFSVLIKITITNYCNLTKSNTEIDIRSKGITQYYHDFGKDGFYKSLEVAQDFLKINNLLLYIKDYGMSALNDKVNLYSSTPKIKYNYEGTNNNYEGR
jgi:hypothetical protein